MRGDEEGDAGEGKRRRRGGGLSEGEARIKDGLGRGRD